MKSSAPSGEEWDVLGITAAAHIIYLTDLQYVLGINS